VKIGDGASSAQLIVSSAAHSLADTRAQAVVGDPFDRVERKAVFGAVRRCCCEQCGCSFGSSAQEFDLGEALRRHDDPSFPTRLA